LLIFGDRQAVFLAYMAVLKKAVNVGLAASLIVSTSIIKILLVLSLLTSAIADIYTLRITRMCRAQFEKDDIAEAEIALTRRGTINMQADEIPDNGDLSRSSLIQTKPRHLSMFTWKFPAWVNFSYTPRHKPLHQRRKPKPLAPKCRSFTRLHSISQDIQQDNKVDPRMHAEPATSFRRPSTSTRLGPITDNFLGTTEITGPVVAHRSPIPWDDQTTVDLPYDNPFYTRTYDDVLWLPRNPCGTLNLDDTIDLKISLTTEVSAGQLGTWPGVLDTNLLQMPQGKDGDFELLEHQSNAVITSLPPIDGTEDIDLPPVIASRVRSGEDGVEQAVRPRRPSAYPRQTTGGDLSLPMSFRSFSDGNDDDTSRLPSSTSTMSPFPDRARSPDQTDQEPGIVIVSI